MSGKALVLALALALGSAWYADPANCQAVTDGLISYWSLDKADIQDDEVKDIWGGQDAAVMGNPKVVAGKVGDALEFGGLSDYLEITDDIAGVKLPETELTLEVWVYPRSFLDWGGYIAACQDNGGFEKGWVLGTRPANKFSLAISSEGADDGDGVITWFTTDSSYDTDKWYHVVGTYDGKEMRIYVNGKLDGSSKAQSGDINYPDKAWYVIGTYKDNDEFFPHNGVIDEVRLYEKALSQDEVLQNYESKGLSVACPAEKLSITWGHMKIAS